MKKRRQKNTKGGGGEDDNEEEETTSSRIRLEVSRCCLFLPLIVGISRRISRRLTSTALITASLLSAAYKYCTQHVTHG